MNLIRRLQELYTLAVGWMLLGFLVASGTLNMLLILDARDTTAILLVGNCCLIVGVSAETLFELRGK